MIKKQTSFGNYLSLFQLGCDETRVATCSSDIAPLTTNHYGKLRVKFQPRPSLLSQSSGRRAQPGILLTFPSFVVSIGLEEAPAAVEKDQ